MSKTPFSLPAGWNVWTTAHSPFETLAVKDTEGRTAIVNANGVVTGNAGYLLYQLLKRSQSPSEIVAGTRLGIEQIVRTFLQDVAEDTTRLPRAIEVATRQVNEELDRLVGIEPSNKSKP